MSGCSDSKPCPICGQDMDVYTDYKPFDTVNMTCIHCGFNGYVKCGMECDEDRRASWEAAGLDIKDFEPLTKKQRREYLKEFKSLCGELSAEDEALYLGLSYKDPNTEYGKSPVSFDTYGFNAARDQVKGILRAKLNCSPDSLAAELTDEIFNALHITPEQQDDPF